MSLSCRYWHTPCLLLTNVTLWRTLTYTHQHTDNVTFSQTLTYTLQHTDNAKLSQTHRRMTNSWYKQCNYWTSHYLSHTMRDKPSNCVLHNKILGMFASFPRHFFLVSCSLSSLISAFNASLILGRQLISCSLNKFLGLVFVWFFWNKYSKQLTLQNFQNIDEHSTHAIARRALLCHCKYPKPLFVSIREVNEPLFYLDSLACICSGSC